MVAYAEGAAMRLAVYGGVLAIARGSVLLSLDWLSAPMSPMVDTKAGLSAAAPPMSVPPPAATANAPAVLSSPAPPTTNAGPPVTSAVPAAPRANIGAPIIAPTLIPPPSPPTSATGAQAATNVPAAAPGPQVRCNVDACTAAYRSFTPADCTYQPSNGPRRLCTK